MLALLRQLRRLFSRSRPTLRVASFNVALYGSKPGAIVERLADPMNDQVKKVVAVLADAKPDIVLIGELDYDADGKAAEALAALVSAALPDRPPLRAYAFPSNTGVPTGLDVLGTGKKGGAGNAFGFGQFPGQYGFALLSALPVVSTRTFQNFLWRDMPGALLPDAKRKSGLGDFFAPEVLDIFRLSSKNHVDAVVDVPSLGPLHLLLSHPTPPVFDGPENRNGRRNHDEIRLWADYISGSACLRDDAGGIGGLSDEARFVVLGDLNADPVKGDSEGQAVLQLLDHPRVNDTRPQGANGDRTAAFRHGDLRVDYALPSANLTVTASGVSWFAKDDPRAPLNKASDHHLVWIDIEI